jgi:ribonuclease E
MTKRMLIDANHPEETRVVILDGSKVEEFDFEAASKRPLKGNIYLAKVTRVEPSLQAAFVEYGGNRQGFLAFAEIHPDYYQIPVADRQALLAEQEAEARRRQEDDIESFEITGPKADGTAEEGEEEVEDDSDNGEDTAEMAPLVPLDAAPEADETEASADAGEDEHEDVFVNHGSAPVEHDHEEDEPAETKSDAALNDFHGDPEAGPVQSAEESEGEPVETLSEASDAEVIEGEILPPSEDGAQSEDGGDAQALQAGRRSAGCARSITRSRKSSSAARSS